MRPQIVFAILGRDSGGGHRAHGRRVEAGCRSGGKPLPAHADRARASNHRLCRPRAARAVPRRVHVASCVTCSQSTRAMTWEPVAGVAASSIWSSQASACGLAVSWLQVDRSDVRRSCSARPGRQPRLVATTTRTLMARRGGIRLVAFVLPLVASGVVLVRTGVGRVRQSHLSVPRRGSRRRSVQRHRPALVVDRRRPNRSVSTRARFAHSRRGLTCPRGYTLRPATRRLRATMAPLGIARARGLRALLARCDGGCSSSTSSYRSR